MKTPLTWLSPLLLCASFASAAAVAPKAGLWAVEVQIGQNDLPQIDPDLLAEFGFGDLQVQTTPEPKRYDVCLTPEQVKQDRFPDLADDGTGCTAKNLRRSGDRLDGDLSCNGWLQGNGRVQIALQDAQRFNGQTAFQGTSQEGIPLNLTGTLNGQWRSANCGDVKPY
ncbi:DUF3617 domain-containing protein [Panacagrimonas perspica]|nr:DUF3617 domain-containing protein [Panacagrimonas perspica]